MKRIMMCAVFFGVVLGSYQVRAETFRVSAESSNNNGPGDSWDTAYQHIQPAIDIAAPGDTVLVTNGVYDSGGVAAPGQTLINRVMIGKAITVRSVNGPEETSIVGNGWNDPVRCAYLTNSASLVGFTLTGGYTVQSGDYNDKVAGGLFLDQGGSVSNCVIRNCISKDSGGGVYVENEGSLVQCHVMNNKSYEGDGGGIFFYYGGMATCSVLSGNEGASGGGAYFYEGGSLGNCKVTSNSASYGGGLFVYHGSVINCTISDNSAETQGGGIYDSTSNYRNNIVYHNTAPATPNIRLNAGTFEYTCTTPSVGSNCMTNDPSFMNRTSGDYSLEYMSLCRDAGNSSYAVGDTDLNSNDRIQGVAVDMGAYEYSEREDTGDSPIHYVRVNSPAPQWPYTSSNSAAWKIQEAVNAASSGDLVRVDDGVYNSGGATVPGIALENRVMIDRAITLESVNGPSNTFIVGEADPASTNGPAAVRCVRLVEGALLSGFTLTNGYTLATGDQNTERGGGGVLLDHGGTVSNCIIVGNSCHGNGGGANLHHGGTLVESTLRDNYSTAGDAGGALIEGGRIEDCDIFNNRADSDDGGGLLFYASGSADNVNIYSNTCADAGGGVYFYNGGTLSNSTIEANESGNGGGGMFVRTGALIENCTIRGNHAGDGTTEDGGGVVFYTGGTVRNCLIAENTAQNAGGGVLFNAAASNAVLESCTIVSNTSEYGGGIRTWGGTVRNSIVYGNTATIDSDNWSWGGNSPTFEYTCITPTNGLPGGTGCIDVAPLFIGGGQYELQDTSPCIDVGANQIWMTGAVDLNGRPRLFGSAVDFGAYENCNIHYGEDPGDSPIHYVSLEGLSYWPYTNWTTAAQVIQDAVDAASTGNTIWVTNGVYAEGQTYIPDGDQYRVVITNDTHLSSVNGPEHTFIVGDSDNGTNGTLAVSGIRLITGSVSGFSITNGFTRDAGYDANSKGGGIYLSGANSTLSNCVVSGCSAGNAGGVYAVQGLVVDCIIKGNTTRGNGSYGEGGGVQVGENGIIERCVVRQNSAQDGGGLFLSDYADIRNCLIVDNNATRNGGGLCSPRSIETIVESCTISDNTANSGGGFYVGDANSSSFVSNVNSIIYGNEAVDGAVYKNGGSAKIYFVNCSTNDPGFVGAENYHLQTGSSCIDAGTNQTWMIDAGDLDGQPRPLDGDNDGTATADIGCYEYLNTAADSDGDGSNDGDEQIADTSLVDSNDWFHITGLSGSTIFFQSSENRLYTLYWSSNLVSNVWKPVQDARMGVGGADFLQSTNNLPVEFYKLEVEIP